MEHDSHFAGKRDGGALEAETRPERQAPIAKRTRRMHARQQGGRGFVKKSA